VKKHRGQETSGLELSAMLRFNLCYYFADGSKESSFYLIEFHSASSKRLIPAPLKYTFIFGSESLSFRFIRQEPVLFTAPMITLLFRLSLS
jgi:hypothetical protein